MKKRSIVTLIFFVVAASVSLAASLPGSAAEHALFTVPRDVDVYDKPGGKGSKVGMLAAKSEVSRLGEDDHWCHVKGDAVPGKKGWVWCGIGDDGQNYELIAAEPASPPTPPAQPVPTCCTPYFASGAVPAYCFPSEAQARKAAESAVGANGNPPDIIKCVPGSENR